MLQIDNTILSFDVFERYFQCDLKKCKGQCCIDGDSGAPLNKDEVVIIKEIYPQIKKYLPEKNINIIEKIGTSEIDKEGDVVTPCINNKNCVYIIYEDEIAICAIEKAFFNKEIKFRKPISCHLFPIRITEYKDFDAVNYQYLNICKHAVRKGKKNNIPIYKFLREALIRKYGKEWYSKVEIAAKEIFLGNVK